MGDRLQSKIAVVTGGCSGIGLATVELFRSEGTLEDMTVAGWDATLSLLLRSTMLGIKHALPAMKAAGGGAIVNTSSVAGLRPGSGLTVKPPNGYPETVQKIAAACGGPG